MRIASFLSYYAPHWTGLTRHAQLVCEGLAARGHEVTVVTSRHTNSLPRRDRLGGVRIIRLEPLARVSRGMVCPSLIWHGIREIRAADIVHLQSPLPEATYLGAWARLLGKKVALTHHADLILPEGSMNRIIQGIVGWNLRTAARMSHLLIAYSDDYAAHSNLLSCFPEKTLSIPPPISIPRPRLDRVPALRAEYGLDNMIVIHTSGRFVREKGHDVLIKAVPFLKNRLGRFKIIFTGEYDSIAYEDFYQQNLSLIQLHQDHLLFLGLIEDRQQLADIYAMADVLAHPSRSECFALVQPESMMCGTPVVVSDVPGGRVPVMSSGMGKTFPSGNPEALADAVYDVITNLADFAAPPGTVGRLFSLETSIDRHERALRNLIDPSHGADQ